MEMQNIQSLITENVDSDIYDMARNTLKVLMKQEYGTLPNSDRTGLHLTGWYTEL